MDIYAKLGVRPLINASGPVTVLGGSLMPPEVVEAMAEAARAFVDLNELHLAAGRRIATLIGVEAAHVCSGAAAGIAVMAAACMASTDPARIRQLPDTTGMPNRFLYFRAHRNPFDQAVREAGGTLIPVDPDPEALAAAIDGTVAAIYYTAGRFERGESLPLAQVAEVAHGAGVPLMVDGAAQVPPLENFRRFLDEGADLVTFSGGKAIRGPQSSGLILGRAGLVEACRLNDNPHQSIGRPMKASKEDIAGLVRAVELYLERDHEADMALWERRVAHVIAALSDLPHVRAERRVPYGIGQQVPTAAVSWDSEALGLGYEDLVHRLLQGEPRIAVRTRSRSADRVYDAYYEDEIRVYPDNLQPGEEEIVARRLRQLLSS
ncbi:MAG: aminotransferase class V-fold PLP-dependent enzyme [Anaerolineae bacterium]|nr:aminotransferase class V-fold PLP-dependent enzyme [Anaerolineae bacterium]